jgi:hypothetical protein
VAPAATDAESGTGPDQSRYMHARADIGLDGHGRRIDDRGKGHCAGLPVSMLRVNLFSLWAKMFS